MKVSLLFGIPNFININKLKRSKLNGDYSRKKKEKKLINFTFHTEL